MRVNRTNAQWMAARTKHGAYVGGTETSEHAVWRTMLARCGNRRRKDYPQYGGRGISVCRSWREYYVFLNDMGPRPTPQHSIERIDNDGNYSASNCRWATRHEQARNKRNNRYFVKDGVSMVLSDWAVALDVSKQLLSYRWNEWGTFEKGKVWLLQRGV